MIRRALSEEYPVLAEIWQRSVEASHDFLTAKEIQQLYTEVLHLYLPQVELWVYEQQQTIVGFIGLSGTHIEMLFIEPAYFGQGIGRQLIDALRRSCPALTVDVNEQNPKACAFYQHYGFQVTGRSASDSAGRPYPLLHLALHKNNVG